MTYADLKKDEATAAKAVEETAAKVNSCREMLAGLEREHLAKVGELLYIRRKLETEQVIEKAAEQPPMPAIA